jgi:hypothetical protein
MLNENKTKCKTFRNEKLPRQMFHSIIIIESFGNVQIMNRSLGKFAIPAATCVAAALTAVSRFLVPADAMPQKSDSDPLAILFGDVRMLIGRRMIGKADEYFHGGVTDIDCSLEHSHHDHAHGPHDHDDHDHPDLQAFHDLQDGKDDHEAVRAPWHFVTRAIRLPSIERHLEGESTREILPWLWAALRVDSGNVNAYANAAYVLDSLYGDKDKALAVLEEGLATNPESAELEFQKGELLLRGFKAPGKAEAAFRAALAKAPRDKHLENRDDIDAPLLSLRSLAYLGRLASDRNDGKEVRRCHDMARAINPDHSATESLRYLVEGLR